MDNRGLFAALRGWKNNLDYKLVHLARRRAEDYEFALDEIRMIGRALFGRR